MRCLGKMGMILFLAAMGMLEACHKKPSSTPTVDDQDTTNLPPCVKNNTGILRIKSSNKYRFMIYLNNNTFGIQNPKTNTDWLIPTGEYDIKVEQMEGYILYPIVYKNHYVILQCDTITISY